tara:strand:- start:184 stop:900 length:717 start_codon:yes stop_codon:yes gene_type:complete
MTLDIIIVLTLLVSGAVSFFRGFIKEVLTIFGLGGAAAGAFIFGHLAIEIFEGWLVDPKDENYKYFDIVPDDVVAIIVAYAAVFIAIFAVLALLSHFLSKGAEAMGLGPVDRSLGAVFGLLRGFLIVAVIYFSFSIFVTDEEFPDFVQESKMIPIVSVVVDWTLDALEIKKPFQEDGLDEDKVKKSIDAIDKVREDYISPDKSKDPSKDKSSQGYKSKERKALENLIEKDATVTGGNE